MNVLKIMSILSLLTVAAPSFADAPRVGEEQVKTNQEKETTAELKQEKVEKNKKLSKARKGMKSVNRTIKTSGSHAEGSDTE